MPTSHQTFSVAAVDCSPADLSGIDFQIPLNSSWLSTELALKCVLNFVGSNDGAPR